MIQPGTRYSAELLDRIADAMSCAQEYYTRIDPGGEGGGVGYLVCYTPPSRPDEPEPAEVVILRCATRDESMDARDVMTARALAAAALMAIGYVEDSAGAAAGGVL